MQLGEGKGIKTEEGIDGSTSHGNNLNNIPKDIKAKVKANPEYGKGQKKQADLDKAKSKIKQMNLKIDWKHVVDVVVEIGIVIACTGTFFFAGDDIGAWINFFRVIGAT